MNRGEPETRVVRVVLVQVGQTVAVVLSKACQRQQQPGQSHGSIQTRRLRNATRTLTVNRRSTWQGTRSLVHYGVPLEPRGRACFNPDRDFQTVCEYIARNPERADPGRMNSRRTVSVVVLSSDTRSFVPSNRTSGPSSTRPYPSSTKKASPSIPVVDEATSPERRAAFNPDTSSSERNANPHRQSAINVARDS